MLACILNLLHIQQFARGGGVAVLLRVVSASLRLFSASIHFGNLKIARYSLHPQNEYLLKNSPQIISK